MLKQELSLSFLLDLVMCFVFSVYVIASSYCDFLSICQLHLGCALPINVVIGSLIFVMIAIQGVVTVSAMFVP